MKQLLTITFLLLSTFGFSQFKAVIINSETKKKVPYVNIWVENENIGATSNEEGEFELKIDSSKIILFSAIGFETKRINSDSIKNTLELKPLVTQLGEVVIVSERQSQELIIGKFKKSKINHYFGARTMPWILARFFEYKEEYSNTPFLKTIGVLTDSDIKDAKFIIRLYSVGENGEPDKYIYDKNIFGIAKKGKNITEIDVSDLNIAFPEEGLFIAIEMLIIESNKYEYKYIIEGSRKKLDGISYEPTIGILPEIIEGKGWAFRLGKWSKLSTKHQSDNPYYDNKFRSVAIELTLTN